MSVNNKAKWIDTGYLQFAQIGPESLKVERLSMIMALNRSSFYHYFGEVSVFEKYLLERHIGCFKRMSKTFETCKNFHPDLIRKTTQYRSELLFHRQLLIHESTPRYRECFNTAKAFTEKKVFKLWATHINYQNNIDKYFSLYSAVRDYFLIHFNQLEEKEIQPVIRDIEVLLHGY